LTSIAKDSWAIVSGLKGRKRSIAIQVRAMPTPASAHSLWILTPEIDAAFAGRNVRQTFRFFPDRSHISAPHLL
jgi:hypothetical protein